MEKILYIVIPCYNEEPVLEKTTRQLSTMIQGMKDNKVVDFKSRILYVDDGSKDATWSLIEQLHEGYKDLVTGVKLAGNVGHQNALLAGLTVASEHAEMIISIDADLQDDIDVIPEMINKYINEGCDIVYGVRNSRTTDTWFKRTTALGFYKLWHISA